MSSKSSKILVQHFFKVFLWIQKPRISAFRKLGEVNSARSSSIRHGSAFSLEDRKKNPPFLDSLW